MNRWRSGRCWIRGGADAGTRGGLPLRKPSPPNVSGRAIPGGSGGGGGRRRLGFGSVSVMSSAKCTDERDGPKHELQHQRERGADIEPVEAVNLSLVLGP
jgi:hypothetical protein